MKNHKVRLVATLFAASAIVASCGEEKKSKLAGEQKSVVYSLCSSPAEDGHCPQEINDNYSSLRTDKTIVENFANVTPGTKEVYITSMFKEMDPDVRGVVFKLFNGGQELGSTSAIPVAIGKPTTQKMQLASEVTNEGAYSFIVKYEREEGHSQDGFGLIFR